MVAVLQPLQAVAQVQVLTLAPRATIPDRAAEVQVDLCQMKITSLYKG